jgi:putative PEP-CTERM system histidine kinase
LIGRTVSLNSVEVHASILVDFSGCFFALLLALGSRWLGERQANRWALTAGLMLLAVDCALNGLRGTIADPDQIGFVQSIRLWCSPFLYGAWLAFSLTFARDPNTRGSRSSASLVAVAAPALILVVLLIQGPLYGPAEYNSSIGAGFLPLKFSGKIVTGLFLISSILVLANMENTFRSSVGTIRWRLKYIVIGVGVIFTARIYTYTQDLLFSGVNLGLQTVNSAGVLLGGGCIALGLLRSGGTNLNIYPSQHFLFKSVSVLFAGIYLLVIGGLAQLVNWIGGDSLFPLRALVVLVAMVGLAIIMMSDRFKQRLRIFVSRHFKRPVFDYRELWSSFAQRVIAFADEESAERAIVRWMAEAFKAMSINLWMIDEQKRLVLAASTAGDTASAATEDEIQGGRDKDDWIQEMCHATYQGDIESSNKKWAREVGKRTIDRFQQGGGRVCVPLGNRTEFIGFFTVGDRIGGRPFATEEFELLKCIGDQAAGALCNVRQSKKLIEAKELEAFQKMSAFFVHDLKNTASTLSLMLENLQRHFDKPGFREDSLKAISKCLERVNNLVGSLSVLRTEIQLKKRKTDLNEIVRIALDQMGRKGSVYVTGSFQDLPGINLDSEQMQKVIVNLVLNAIDAVGREGNIRVETSRRSGWATITVTDDGCGMDPKFVKESLFKPFRTTKKQGIGIGLYHCKAIVEAHQGKIEVESEKGRGTQFRVMLPLPDADEEKNETERSAKGDSANQNESSKFSFIAGKKNSENQIPGVAHKS